MGTGTVNYHPLYLQVKDVLLKRIVDNEYGPGELIPSESRLAEDFGTSISTVRQALSILVADGELQKKQGRGTFVATQQAEISFLSWLPETKQGENLLLELVRRFEAKNPSVRIRVISTSYIDARQTLMNMVSTGNAPDVAQIVSHWTSYFASVGALEPLDKFLGDGNLSGRYEERDLYGGVYQDSVYSVAWGLCPLSLIANKNVLAETGIGDLPMPMSLDLFEDVCTRISSFYADQDKFSYGLNVLHDETDFLRIYTFLQAFDGGFVNENEEVIINVPANVAAFTWLRKFVRSVKILDTDIYSIRKRFAQNDVAFITDGPWVKYQLEDMTGEPFEKNFAVVLNPVRNGNTSLSWNYNHALSICAQSPHKIHAGRFIDAITSDHDLSDFYFARSGHLPINPANMSDEAFGSEFFEGFKKQLQNSKCLNARNPMFEKAMVLCMDAVKKLLFSDVDIKTELDEKEYYLNMLYYDTPEAVG